VRKLLATVAFAAGVAFAGAAAADSLRIATEGAYPPFNETNANGELIGFDVDIARALCDKMGADCEIVGQDWDGIIPGLQTNKYDAIIASMSITDERKEMVDFSDRYYTSHLRFVAPEGVEIDGSSDSLDGKTIGAQRATISSQYLEDNYRDLVSIKVYDTQEAAFLDLKSGRIDAVLADVFPAHDWLQSDEGAGHAFTGPKLAPNDEIGIAVRKDEEELLARFNKALAEILADGTYEKINAKYFPFSIY